MNWRAMENSDRLTEEADALMPTLRFVPPDAEGKSDRRGEPDA
jgi:hypothetical protein